MRQNEKSGTKAHNTQREQDSAIRRVLHIPQKNNCCATYIVSNNSGDAGVDAVAAAAADAGIWSI